MARSKGRKRPFAPGAGQDAGRQRGDSSHAEEHSFKGREVGGKLHKQGEKTRRTPAPKATASAKPRPKAKTTTEDIAAFSAAAARRGAPPLTAQRDRLIALGIIRKEVTNV